MTSSSRASKAVSVDHIERPFFRSPPFPGVAPDEAAISQQRADAPGNVAIDDPFLNAIAQARVGGTFWGDRPTGVKLLVRQGVMPPATLLEGLAHDEIGILPVGGVGKAAVAGRMLPPDCDPWALVEQAQAVCALPGDDVATVAFLLGKPVFGPDKQAVPPATLKAVTIGRLARVAYRDCFTGATINVADALELLSDWRRHLDGNRGLAAASGMAFWKRQAIRHFLWDGVRSPPFLSARHGLAQARRHKGALAVWPSRVPPTIAADAADAGVALARVEAGFLRSRGLGAALHPPGSVVVDRRGIYYDATAPSDLEQLLANHPFPQALVERAARLRARLCATGVTKYGDQAGAATALPPGRRTVLAVGQVDDDLSVRLGGAGVGGNLDFLERVRRVEPDAWIIYRPHPDVQAGHRRGHLSEAAILRHADAIDTGGSLMALVEAVDEVHVLSSLTGFEALIRGISVTVHGMPFYAGWGLTRDLARANPRRGRLLTVDQLVAGTLILYPRYLDPVTGLPCGPELMVDRMASNVAPATNWLIRLRSLQGRMRRLMTLSAEFFHG